MSKQPEALRWAEHLERHSHYIGQDLLIAAELRRLHAINGELLQALQKLVEASHDSDDARYGTLSTNFVRNIARDAIAKATGEQQ